MPRIGLFGGTFDPPHLGHAILAAEALHALNLDTIFWILTPQSPLKDGRNISPLEQRLALLKIALQNEPGFALSEVDVKRQPPFYAVDTVRIFQKENPGAELIYLMGGDSLEDMPAWYEPQKFVDEIAGLGVFRRPGSEPDLDQMERQIKGIKKKITFFTAPQIEISAADIRQRIKEGRPVRFFLIPAVYQFIEAHHYYR